MAQPEKMAKLTNLLAYTSWDTARMARRKALELIGTGAVVATVGVLLLHQVITWWHGGSWWGYISSICGGTAFLLGFLLSVSSLRWEWSEQQRMLKAALALRGAAEEKNDELAPLAAEQPLPLSPEELAAGPERFNLFSSWKDSSLAAAGFGVLFLLAGVGFGVLLVIVVMHTQSDTGLAIAAFVLLAFVLVLASLTLATVSLVFLLVLPWSKPFRAYVVADERGLLWWRNGWRPQPVLLEWKAARSFFVMAYAGEGKIKGCKVYVLDGHDRLYLWRLYDTIPEEKRAMFERFARVVAARSGLPLRDLSAAAEQATRIAEQLGEV